MRNEYWRDVPGYEGKYQICIEGKECRCRSLNYRNTGTIKELSNTPGKRDGRITWILTKNGKPRTLPAARWVALTFPELVENEFFEGAELDHKDTNRLNDHPGNLKWVTHKENCNNPLTLLHNSECRSGEKCWFYGRKHTEETKKKMSNSAKVLWSKRKNVYL